jgi:hypothetical protein
MQLAVIDDLITQHKAIIKKYPDDDTRKRSVAYLSGFIDCARQAQVISEADFESFKVQVLELLQC